MAATYWTLVDSHQITLETRGVLSPSELQKFSTFRFPKRRDEWLLGRWTAKTLVNSLPAYQRYSLDQIEISSTFQGAPCIRLPDGTIPADCLTISHSNTFAFCALAAGSVVRIGADLEKIEVRTETFILDYFTPGERQIVATFPHEIRATAATLIWSLKESMLKALGVGLRWDTRAVEVKSLPDSLASGDTTGKWQKVTIGEAKPGQRAFAGWWQHRDPFILTLAGLAESQADLRSLQLVEKQVGG